MSGDTQMQARGFGEPEPKGILREYRALVERFPEDLSGATRVAFEYDLRMLMVKGIYRDHTGHDEVRVVYVALHPAHNRAIDAYVEYETLSGHLVSGRLPVLFFLETHRFVRIDAAAL